MILLGTLLLTRTISKIFSKNDLKGETIPCPTPLQRTNSVLFLLESLSFVETRLLLNLLFEKITENSPCAFQRKKKVYPFTFQRSRASWWHTDQNVMLHFPFIFPSFDIHKLPKLIGIHPKKYFAKKKLLDFTFGVRRNLSRSLYWG